MNTMNKAAEMQEYCIKVFDNMYRTSDDNYAAMVNYNVV